MSSKQAALDLASAAIDSTPIATKAANTPCLHSRCNAGSPAGGSTHRRAPEKPQWMGPFATIETACLSIARKLAIEIADRHTQSIERHRLTPDDLLYGLKPTTRLDEP